MWMIAITWAATLSPVSAALRTEGHTGRLSAIKFSPPPGTLPGRVPMCMSAGRSRPLLGAFQIPPNLRLKLAAVKDGDIAQLAAANLSRAVSEDLVGTQV